MYFFYLIPYIFSKIYITTGWPRRYLNVLTLIRMEIRLIFPNFCHLKELYDLEHGKSPKMAYKFNKKVLHPQTIEKTSVKLADAVFHESTKNALTLC